MKRPTIVSLWLFAALAIHLPARAGEWANLKGKVVIRFAQPPVIQGVPLDESLVVADDGALANVVLYVRTPDVPIHPDLARQAPPNVTVTFKDSTVRPRVSLVWTGQQHVEFKNHDGVAYNPNLQPLGDQPANFLLPAGATTIYFPHRQQSIPVPMSCNIKSWIKAYLLPRNNPYMTVTNAQGEFKLQKLPAQALELQLWHERFGYLETPGRPKGRFTLDLKPGDNDLGMILVER